VNSPIWNQYRDPKDPAGDIEDDLECLLIL